MKKLRLLLLKECHKNCAGCCNNDWNLDKLYTEKDYTGYDEILLTGGEPMLKPALIKETVKNIRKVNKSCKIFVYSALAGSDAWKEIIEIVDGVTITLHDNSDIPGFITFLENINYDGKSMRLNIFKGVNFKISLAKNFKIKKDIEWIANCPLPLNETFAKGF